MAVNRLDSLPVQIREHIASSEQELVANAINRDGASLREAIHAHGRHAKNLGHLAQVQKLHVLAEEEGGSLSHRDRL